MNIDLQSSDVRCGPRHTSDLILDVEVACVCRNAGAPLLINMQVRKIRYGIQGALKATTCPDGEACFNNTRFELFYC